MIEVSRHVERSFARLQGALKEAVESTFNSPEFDSTRLHMVNHPTKHLRLVIFFASGPEEYSEKRKGSDREFNQFINVVADLVERHVRYNEIRALVYAIRQEYPTFKWGVVVEAKAREFALVER